MEYVGGGDIASKIEECKKRHFEINETTIWKYFCQILIGLKKLHDMKIIHRDIKSANLFLSKNYEVIKLGDLGVAKIAKQDFAKTQIGTPLYLAPEIWKNHLYDYRADIFSLGVVVYEMAALKVPFNGVSLQDLFKNINRGIIKRVPKKYSNDLYNIIKLMLTKSPTKRPTASQLLAHPLVKKRLMNFNLVDFNKEKKELDELMATIVVPRNLSKLNKRLPKKKRYRASSCSNIKYEEKSKQKPDSHIDLLLNKKRKEQKMQQEMNSKINSYINHSKKEIENR